MAWLEDALKGTLAGFAGLGLRGVSVVLVGIVASLIPATSIWFADTTVHASIAAWTLQGLGVAFVLFGLWLVWFDVRSARSDKVRADKTESLQKLLDAAEQQMRQQATTTESLRAELQKARKERESHAHLIRELNSFRQNELEKRQEEARQKFRYASGLLMREKPSKVLRSLATAIVQICESSPRNGLRPQLGGFPDAGDFWVKIYVYDEEKESLSVISSSTGSPRGVLRHELKKGQGGAGSLIELVEERIQLGGSGAEASFFSRDDLERNLSPKQVEMIEATGVQSMLAAAIFLRTVRNQDGKVGYPRAQPQASPIGVVCFCSRLPENETALKDKEKHANCEQAAQLMGVLLGRTLFDDEALSKLVETADVAEQDSSASL